MNESCLGLEDCLAKQIKNAKPAKYNTTCIGDRVYDYTRKYDVCRPYFFDTPEFNKFVDENKQIKINVATKNYTIDTIEKVYGENGLERINLY